MGVTRRADAGEAQLDEGLAFLRTELVQLTRLHPEEAKRLRIPASVEAIGERLSAPTDDR